MGRLTKSLLKCLSRTEDMIGRDDVVSEDLTEGVIVQDGGCVDVSEGGEVPDDVGQDVSRGPHLHQETFLGCA